MERAAAQSYLLYCTKYNGKVFLQFDASYTFDEWSRIKQREKLKLLQRVSLKTANVLLSLHIYTLKGNFTGSIKILSQHHT